MKGGKEGVLNDLIPFLKIVASVPISTSECEQNFSAMNEIITPLRPSLNITIVSAPLFFNCVN